MPLEPGGSQGGTVRFVLPLNVQLSGLLAADPHSVTIFFVRINGNNALGSEVIRIGEARIELSTDMRQ